MDKSTPLHNDIYQSNLIWGKDDKIYFVDWEYATMGDKHFDLAFFYLCRTFRSKTRRIIIKNLW